MCQLTRILWPSRKKVGGFSASDFSSYWVRSEHVQAFRNLLHSETSSFLYLQSHLEIGYMVSRQKYVISLYSYTPERRHLRWY